MLAGTVRSFQIILAIAGDGGKALTAAGLLGPLRTHPDAGFRFGISIWTSHKLHTTRL